MANTFLISDPHFGHKGVTQFLKADGTKLRPWDTIEEMNEALVSNWNSVVRPEDKIIVVGDVAINRKWLPICERLNGIKTVVMGNHDVFRPEEYTPYFKYIRGALEYDRFIITHIPVHPNQLERWKANIHGHTHSNNVMKEIGMTVKDDKFVPLMAQDERYYCVCVEQINFTPIPFEVVKKEIMERLG